MTECATKLALIAGGVRASFMIINGDAVVVNAKLFQALLTRLARATERLKKVDGENVRESLSNAIQLFRCENRLLQRQNV